MNNSWKNLQILKKINFWSKVSKKIALKFFFKKKSKNFDVFSKTSNRFIFEIFEKKLKFLKKKIKKFWKDFELFKNFCFFFKKPSNRFFFENFENLICNQTFWISVKILYEP